MNKEINKCVMCGTLPEERINNVTLEWVRICFIDSVTKEQLCESCNKINDGIYAERGRKERGQLIVIK